MSEDLLIRLDRVGVHQSVAARYCKEAAEEIRTLRAENERLRGLLQKYLYTDNISLSFAEEINKALNGGS